MITMQRVNATYRAQARRHEAVAIATLRTAHARMKAAVMPPLLTFAEAVQAEAAEDDIQLTRAYPLPTLQHLVSAHTSAFADAARATIIGSQQQAVTLGNQAAYAQLQTLKNRTWKPPTRMSAAPKALAARLQTLPQETNNRITRALLLVESAAIAMGMFKHMVEKAIDRLRSWVTTIEVTTFYDTYRSTMLDWYQANDDVVEGWTWRTAEDERVCAFCDSMDGTNHSLDEELDAHPNCRCEPEPFTVVVPAGMSEADVFSMIV